jgi:hypothetical protein
MSLHRYHQNIRHFKHSYIYSNKEDYFKGISY